MKKPTKLGAAKANEGKHTLSAHGSIRLNRRIGGKFPHLTVCAEAWILDYRVRVFLLDLLMVFLFWELNHCRNQYLTYGVKHDTRTPPSNQKEDEMSQVWLAYVDDVENGSRENWNVFHCNPFVGSSMALVTAAAKSEITKRATENCKDNGDPLSDVPAYEAQYHAHVVGPLTMIL